MSTSNTAFIPRATAMLLPSLPWSTDAVIKNPAILPENISQQYQVNQIVPPSESWQTFLGKLYKKEEELMLETNLKYGKEGIKPLCNYFCGILGYKTERVTYEQDQQIAFQPLLK